MNILHVNASFEPFNGGPYHETRGMCKALVMRGHNVTLYTTDVVGRGSMNPLPRRTQRLEVPKSQPIRRDGYEVWHFPVQWPSRWCYSPALANALARNVCNYDIVHIQSLYLFSTQAAAFFCRRAGIPYLIRPHGTLNPIIRRRSQTIKWLYDMFWQRGDLQRAAAIHCATQDEMNYIRTFGIRAPLVVIPSCVDLDAYNNLPERGQFRTRYLDGWDGLVVLYMGRITFTKGLELLIDGFAQIYEVRNDTRLVIAGWDDPPEFGKAIRQRLVSHGIADRTIFTGALFGRDKLAALADADVWALPSYGDSFGVAVVEAMISGLPVVISHKVGLYSDVVQAEAGLVVDCNADQVASAIARLLDNPAERRRMGENGRRFATEKYGLENVGKQLEQIYQEIVRRDQ